MASDKGTTPDSTPPISPIKQRSSNPFSRKICGDLFGTGGGQSIDGILYKSRTTFSRQRDSPAALLAKREEWKSRRGRNSGQGDSDDSSSCGGSEDGEEDDEHDKIYGFEEDSDSEDDDEAVSALTSRQRLALTLKNWCAEEANVQLILDEGAVHSLVSIAKSQHDDPKVHRYCAQAFFHLSEKSKFRRRLVEQGAMSALLHLSNAIATAGAKSRLMRENLGSGNYPLNCAAAICNLTLLDGSEAQLVNDGAVVALRMILTHQATHDPGSDIGPICVQALFNLTCVEEQYDELEQVIKALIAIQPTGQMDPRVITASASCNCSNFFKLRARMIEAGVIQVLGTIVAKSDLATFMKAPKRVKRRKAMVLGSSLVVATNPIARNAASSLKLHVAVCLHNIATARACRADMIVRGAGVALMQLSQETSHPTVMLVVTAALQKLTLDRASRIRLLDKGGIAALTRAAEVARNLLRSSTTSSPTRRQHGGGGSRPGPESDGGSREADTEENRRELAVCICREIATTLYNLSSDDRCIVPIVSAGALSVLVDVCAVEDMETRKYAANTFCNIMSFDDVHPAVLRSKTLPSLFDFASRVTETQVVYALSVAFLNLSLGENTRGEAVAAGIVQPMVRFSTLFSEVHILECCSAALSFLATLDSNIETMVQDGVLHALGFMLSCGFAEVTSRCAGALATIAYNHDSHEDLIGTDLIRSVIDAAIANTDPRTREACCAVLASLSFTPASHVSMRDLGVIPGFMKIARSDESTARRCATALCNLAMEHSLRKEMVDQGVVGLMNELSNTYSEITLQDCAKCLCNLSCDPETPCIMVDQGAIGTLMMVCMVRSVSDTTKLMCAKAFLNLVHNDTLEEALESGVVHALAALSSQDNEETMEICANLFCVVSCSPDGCRVIAERSATFQGLFSLMRSKEKETQLICGKAVCNLLRNPESQTATARAGALLVIKVLATLGDTECERYCTASLALLAQDDACRRIIVQEKASHILVLLAQSQSPATVLSAVKAMSFLAYFASLRAPLVEAGAVSSIMCLVLSGNFMEDMKEDCARTLCYLAMSKDSRERMITEKAVYGLVILCNRSGGKAVLECLCALALQRFSWTKTTHRALLEDGGIDMVVALINKACKGYDSELLPLLICDCMTTLANVASSSELIEGLLEIGVAESMARIASEHYIQADLEAVWRISFTIFHLSQASQYRMRLVNNGLVASLVDLVRKGNEASKQCCAAALCNLSKEKRVQKGMVEAGALKVLVDLSQRDNMITKQWCSIAIANLSGHAKVGQGDVQALIQLANEEEQAQAQAPTKVQASAEVKAKAQSSTKKIRALVSTGLVASLKANMRASPNFDPEYQKLRDLRTTNRLVQAEEKDGQLIRVPPAVQSFLGSSKEHQASSAKLIEEMMKKLELRRTRTEAGSACPEMKPPKPALMKKIRFGSSGASNEDDDDGSPGGQDAGLAFKAAQSATAGNPYGGDDIVPFKFSKMTRIPDLEPKGSAAEEVKVVSEEDILARAKAQQRQRQSRVVSKVSRRAAPLPMARKARPQALPSIKD